MKSRSMCKTMSVFRTLQTLQTKQSFFFKTSMIIGFLDIRSKVIIMSFFNVAHDSTFKFHQYSWNMKHIPTQFSLYNHNILIRKRTTSVEENPNKNLELPFTLSNEKTGAFLLFNENYVMWNEIERQITHIKSEPEEFRTRWQAKAPFLQSRRKI